MRYKIVKDIMKVEEFSHVKDYDYIFKQRKEDTLVSALFRKIPILSTLN